MFLASDIIEKVFLPAVAALAIGGGSAYVDIKSDLAVGEEKDQHQEKQLDKIEEKLDKIIEHLLLEDY